MKRTWVAILVAVALVIPTIAVAEEPVAAWCGGSYGAAGTNFGECVKVETKARVAGAAGGMREQTVSVPTFPEYPASMVTFEGGRAVYYAVDKDGKAIKKELNFKHVAAPDRFNEVESPGD